MNVTNVQQRNTDGFSISIVVYRPDAELLAGTLASLAVACGELRRERPELAVTVCLVDNGGLIDAQVDVDLLEEQGISYSVVSGHGNVGYGRGHNLAIERATSAYHLVLNPDVDLDPAALVEALTFFERHPDAGLLAPRIGDENGGLQYLCRRYPTLFDLFVRGFLPHGVQRYFRRRLSRYEMRDVINEREVVWDPPIVSGCFMLFRTDLLKRLAGFDPRYFLYFEDYDLSLRAHDVARIAYVPSVRVLHHGGGASRKGSAHLKMFAASAFKFFNRFGWKWL
ncbi:N-acetylglucosaminyl-diphospho-decaprenol L-rhamnosyltransferase [Paraburkholderia nemoris]|uniref:glycosyltransferase family 2 protein n=1 Tax=Paraburkholderia nemoris TaxID=2793076 RepID=UPI001914B296|nr:glycosyltransferase family 2 protein [Paraburkholderia nemoris]MBK5151787.1 glycosyltransferase family 2 protein [Burkholderia sp. R-69608]CAE6923380.1 N-acetylglucosaminyl-diphospho-decaprenol L-rhamnosyltransferase [Paraburkholderia nemoris]